MYAKNIRPSAKRQIFFNLIIFSFTCKNDYRRFFILPYLLFIRLNFQTDMQRLRYFTRLYVSHALKRTNLFATYNKKPHNVCIPLPACPVQINNYCPKLFIRPISRGILTGKYENHYFRQ